METNSIPSVLALHQEIVKNTRPLYRFDESKDFKKQQEEVRQVYQDIIGLPEKKIEPKLTIEYTKTDDARFEEVRFSFESEPGFFMPGHLLLPKGSLNNKNKLPVVICLQGHSTGMHISLGRAKFDGDEKTIQGGDRDFAVQAVAQGYAAIALEQRGFGELDGTVSPGVHRCQQPAMQALLLGRTLIGERAFDVSRLIDLLPQLPKCDETKVGLMGNSGGGTATFYTACIEPRIKIAMPSCAFCSIEDSIFNLHHCVCNYMPGLLKNFEMGDLAILIAPRPLIIVAGKDDLIFPLDGVKREFETVKRIYQAAGAPDNCKLVIGEEGHRFYAAQSWPVFRDMLVKLL